jgi:hypothetical protein
MNPVFDRRRRRRIGKVLVLVGIAPLTLSILLSIIEVMLGGFLIIPPVRVAGPVFRADEVGLEGFPPDARVRLNFVARCITASGEQDIPWHMQREYTVGAVWLARGESGAGTATTDEQRDHVLRTQRGSLDTYLRSTIRFDFDRDETARAVFRDMLKKGETTRTFTGFVWPNVPHAVSGLFRGFWSGLLPPIILGVGAGLWSSSHKRIPPGFCLRCGYDLRGTPPSAVCPECGDASSPGTPAKAAPSEP